MASHNGYDKIVAVLIIAKADVNIANKVSNIYVHMCMQNYNIASETIEIYCNSSSELTI